MFFVTREDLGEIHDRTVIFLLKLKFIEPRLPHCFTPRWGLRPAPWEEWVLLSPLTLTGATGEGQGKPFPRISAPVPPMGPSSHRVVLQQGTVFSSGSDTGHFWPELQLGEGHGQTNLRSQHQQPVSL